MLKSLKNGVFQKNIASNKFKMDKTDPQSENKSQTQALSQTFQLRKGKKYNSYSFLLTIHPK